MALPIKLLIQRKIEGIPIKNPKVYTHRSEWETVTMIDYLQTRRIFTCFGGPIKTDAQFALFLLQNFGEGDYYIRAWREKRKGFYNFLRITCLQGTFKRVEKRKTQEEKEVEEFKYEKRRLNKMLGAAESESEKSDIQKDIQDIEDDKDLNKMIIESGDVKRGPAPYLKSTMPLYREHEYESFGYTQSDQKVDMRIF